MFPGLSSTIASHLTADQLWDEQVEYQVRDRLSFSRFLGLAIEDGIPGATTLWLFREKLAKAGLIEKLFDRFDQHLAAKGYIARGGQIIDASIVPVPTQRNSRNLDGLLLPPCRCAASPQLVVLVTAFVLTINLMGTSNNVRF